MKMMNDVADLLMAIRHLSEQLDGLPGRVAAAVADQCGRDGPTLTRIDRAALASIYGAVARGRGGSIVLSATDALKHVSAASSSEQDALMAAIGDLDSKTAARRLGKLLSRGEGVAIDSRYITRCLQRREGMLWRLIQI